MTEYKKGFECGKQRVLKYPEDFDLCKKTLTAWSEEDEKKRKRIMHRLSLDGTINNKDLADINDWLKSLKPQNTWKPTEEQIDALEDAIADAISSIQKNMLNSLYSDLKKLKE